MSNELPDFLKFVRRKIKGDGPNKRTGIPGDIGGGGLFSGADPDNPNVMHFGGDGPNANAGGDGALSVDPSERQSSGLAEVVKLYAQQQEAALNTGGSGASPNDPATNGGAASPVTRPRRATPTSEPQMGPLSRAINDSINAQQPATRADVAVPVEGRSASTPAPAGVEYDPAATATRERITDPAGRLEKQIGYEQANPATDRDGRVKTGLKEAVRGFLENGLPGAILRGARGAIDPSVNEKRGQAERVGGWQKQLSDIRGREKQSLEREEARAGVRLKNAQATDLETQKPLRDAAKREDQEKRALLAELKTLPVVDATKNAVFLAKWKKLYGEDFNAEAWNNKKGNFIIRGLITDPSKPQEKHDIAFNFSTGESRDMGLSGYTPPLDAQGMSEEKRRSDSDRDATRENTEAFRAQLLGLSSARLQESMLNGLTGRAAKTFSTKTTGLFAERGRLETQINGYRTRASKREISPAESERRIAELQKKVDEITGRIDDARSEAVGEMGGASRSRRAGTPAPSSPSQPAPKGRVSRKNFDKVREDNPSLRGKSDAQVEAELKARGIEVY